MTLTELREIVKEILQQETNSERVTNDMLTNRLNKAQRFIAMQSGYPLKSQSGTAVASQANYSLGSDWFKIKDIRYGSTNNFRLLEFMSHGEYRALGSITTGYVTHYTVDVTTKEVLFYPTPSNSTDTYSIHYLPIITQMANDSDTPFNGDVRMAQFDYDLADLATNYILAKDAGRPPMEAETAFLPKIKQIKDALSSVETSGKILMKPYSPESRRVRPVLPSNYPRVW